MEVTPRISPILSREQLINPPPPTLMMAFKIKAGEAKSGPVQCFLLSDHLPQNIEVWCFKMSSLYLLSSCLKTGRRAGISCQHSTMKAYMRLGQSSGQGNSWRDLSTNQKSCKNKPITSMQAYKLVTLQKLISLIFYHRSRVSSSVPKEFKDIPLLNTERHILPLIQSENFYFSSYHSWRQRKDLSKNIVDLFLLRKLFTWKWSTVKENFLC